MFRFIIEGVLLTIVSAFGIIGNIIAIYILSRPIMKASFSTLLIGLSLFDTLYLVVGIAIFGFPEIFSEWYMNQVNVYIMPIGYGLAHIGRVGSVFITVSVTIERYLAIVHPLQHFRGKKYLLYIPTIMTVIYNIPKFFEFETKNHLDANGTKDIKVLALSDLRSNTAYATYYVFWSKFILVEVIPYCTIVVLNSLIVAKIWKSIRFRKKLPPAYVSYATRLTSTSFANVSSQDVIKQNDTQQMEVAKMVSKNADSSAKRNQSVTSDKVESKSILLTDRQQREANLGTILVGISLLFICCQSIKIIPDAYEVINCRLKDGSEEVHSRENSTHIELPDGFFNINSDILSNDKNISAQDFTFKSLELTRKKFIPSNSSKNNALRKSWKPVNNLRISSSQENVSSFEMYMHNESSNSSDALLLNCPTTPLIEQLIVISHLLLAINSSANVIIYLFIGEKFREVVKSSFRRKRRRRLSNNIELRIS